MTLCRHKQARPSWSLSRLLKTCTNCEYEEFHKDVEPLKIPPLELAYPRYVWPGHTTGWKAAEPEDVDECL